MSEADRGWGWSWGTGKRQHNRVSDHMASCGTGPSWWVPEPRWCFDESLPRCRRCARD